jgi:hypothetical protein
VFLLFARMEKGIELFTRVSMPLIDNNSITREGNVEFVVRIRMKNEVFIGKKLRLLDSPCRVACRSLK